MLGVEGIAWTVLFYRWELSTPEFTAGNVHTRWVEEALAAGRFQPPEGAASSSPAAATQSQPVRLLVEVDGRRVPVKLWGDAVRTAPAPPAAATGAGADGGKLVEAPMQGTILKVMVSSGQAIAAGDVVCILEAMKMENHITAEHDGTVG